MGCCGSQFRGSPGCACGGSCGCSQTPATGISSRLSSGISRTRVRRYRPAGAGIPGYDPAGAGGIIAWSGPAGTSGAGCWEAKWRWGCYSRFDD